MSPDKIKDTDTVLAELASESFRIRTKANRLEKLAEIRSRRYVKIESEIRSIQKVIETALTGRRIEWLKDRMEDLETYGYAQEELAAVPPHIINHTIALCKQAIANRTPSNM